MLWFLMHHQLQWSQSSMTLLLLAELSDQSSPLETQLRKTVGGDSFASLFHPSRDLIRNLSLVNPSQDFLILTT